jgi:hypothetical protein
VFDLIVMVDWSASSVPKRGADSIWIARLDVGSGALEVENVATRRAAEELLRAVLTRAADRRVLVGVDVPYGYPAGFAACVPGRSDPHRSGDWRAVWCHLADEIVDDDRNRNNRFEVAARLNGRFGAGPGPFWGCPPRRAAPTLDPRKVHRFPVAGPAGPIAEFRVAERRSADNGRRPLSVWQTAYAGSVGSQALVAIPVIARLVDHPALADRSEVWPFTTGLTRDPTGERPDAIVHAEIWPSAFEVQSDLHDVKDAAQVMTVCRRLAGADTSGRLGDWFAPRVDAIDIERVVTEEGWILGVE